jgi:hypothetical protein
MDKYHDIACKHNDTERRCRQQGITYCPVVFSAQGGVGRHAEFVIARIAGAIAEYEHTDADVIKNQLIEKISEELAQRSASAVGRRRPGRHRTTGICETYSALCAASRGMEDVPEAEDDEGW